MLTVKQIERWWQIKAYERLIDELVSGRAEAVGGIRQLLMGPFAASSLAIIRLEELHQGQNLLVTGLLRYLLASQEANGGWQDPCTTSLCLRALHAGHGNGQAIERGYAYLDEQQREDGTWPRYPLHRMPGDPACTAFVIRQLAECGSDRASVLIDRTLDRLISDTGIGDEQLLILKRRASRRSQHVPALWS